MEKIVQDELTQPITGDDSTFLGHKNISRDLLPVYKHKTQILYSVEKYSVTIIIAETGSGKTTCNNSNIIFQEIPQFLVDAGYALNNKKIAITLPARIGALSCSSRVSAEMQTPLGDQVGFHIRFNNCQSQYTMVKFLTDGMMIKEMMSDPLLDAYSVIMIDDMHVRTVNTDTLLGLLKKIRRKRPDLKIIVSSATLDAEQLSKFFYDEKFPQFETNILNVEGRLHPAVETTLMIHQTKKDGDILVFLTGQEEIETFCGLINDNIQAQSYQKKLFCCKLYANMSIDAQMQIFEKTPQNARKVIVATNIAESTVTIDNIVYVIDSCFVKMKHYDYIRGCESLVIVPISQSSGQQRAGRAGRVKPGECYRLCTKESFEAFFESTTPEILRCQLSQVILQLKSLGVGSLKQFDFLTKPSEESLVRALELLYSLKAIDINGELTQELGAKYVNVILYLFRLAELPLEAKLAVILMNSTKEEFGCAVEILPLVAMLSVQNIFYSNAPFVQVKAKKKLGAMEGDHISLINIFIRYKNSGKNEKKRMCSEHSLNEKSLSSAINIHYQLEEFLRKHKLPIESAQDDIECILRCIATGLFANVAQRQPDGTYKGIRSRETLSLHAGSVLNTVFPDWVMYSEIVKTGKYFMVQVSELDFRWLLEIAPHFYEDNTKTLMEEKHQKEIQAQNEFQKDKKIQNNDTKEKKSLIKPMQFGKGKRENKQINTGNKQKVQKQSANMLTFDFDF